MSNNRRGFTLVELLAVVMVIGVLAAIALPKYAGTRDKAKLAALKSDVRNAQLAEESYYGDNGHYAALAQLESDGLIAHSPNTSMQLVGGGNGYKVRAVDASIESPIKTCLVDVGLGAPSSTDGMIICQ